MQVLILPSWYFTPGTPSITGFLFYEHALELRKLGVDAQIAYARYSSTSWSTSRSTFTVERGVPTWRREGWFPPKIHERIIKWWIRKSGIELIRHFHSNTSPDLIHAQGYQAAWIADFIYQKTGIPYLVTEQFSGFLQQDIPLLHAPFIRQAFNNARLITAVSPGLKDQLTSYTIRPIIVIPNYYNSDIFFPDATLSKTEHFQWLSIGEPIHTKGLDLLVEAFSRLVHSIPNERFRLVLADKIPNQHVLKRLGNHLGIADRIEFPGLLCPDEVATLIRKSHVLVSASRYETFGKTILEANACGIPVVASLTAGSAFIMQSDNQGITCASGSADALEKAMLEMYYRYDAFDKEAVYAAVASRFRKEELLAQWITLYNDSVHDS